MSKTLVLDIDATLICAHFFDPVQFQAWMNDPNNKCLLDRVKITAIVDIRDDFLKGAGNICYCVAILRPHVKEFLKFCMSYFDKVSVWSAGHKRYVYAVLSSIFDDDDYQKIDRILTKKDCNFLNTNGDILLKDLNIQGFDLRSTIIIDDNKHSFANNSDNAIHIPAYNPQLTKSNVMYDDTSLLTIMEWLKRSHLKDVSDVRSLDKSKIFSNFTQVKI
jgi:TFIIF-interacting CTD phosphatase-like protein